MKVLNQLAKIVQDTSAFYKIRRRIKDIQCYIRKIPPDRKRDRIVTDLNKLLDDLLVEVNQIIRDDKSDTTELDPINTIFKKKFMGLSFNGTVNARDIKLVGLDTIYRKENCTLTAHKCARLLSCKIALKSCRTTCENYELFFGPIHTSGKISADVSNNTISIQLQMELKKEKLKNIVVTRAEVTTFDHVQISLTGFGKLGGNQLVKAMINMYINSYKERLIADINASLKENMQKIIDKYTK